MRNWCIYKRLDGKRDVWVNDLRSTRHAWRYLNITVGDAYKKFGQPSCIVTEKPKPPVAKPEDPKPGKPIPQPKPGKPEKGDTVYGRAFHLRGAH